MTQIDSIRTDYALTFLTDAARDGDQHPDQISRCHGLVFDELSNRRNEIARLTRERDDLRDALHAMMSAVFAFQNDDARRPDFAGNPYNCPMPRQGEALLKAYDLASIARANSPINADKETGG